MIFKVENILFLYELDILIKFLINVNELLRNVLYII